jgi:hypothetical protein
MSIRIACAAALLAAYSPTAQLCAQGTPAGVVGWYNGDWRPAIPSSTNWHANDRQFAHIYDDFVVPAGGWTVAGVFAHLSMRTGAVKQAFWEIRSGVSSGEGGVVVASGVGDAAMTRAGTVGGGQEVYLIQVNGLWTTLPPGRYWLSVAPVTQIAESYLCKTLGDNAIGEPRGANGESYAHRTADGAYFTPNQGTGQGGASADHSLGVIISGAATARESAWQANLAWLTAQMSTLHSLPFPGVSAELSQGNRRSWRRGWPTSPTLKCGRPSKRWSRRSAIRTPTSCGPTRARSGRCRFPSIGSMTGCT